MADSLRTQGFYSLFAKFNKKKGTSDEENKEGLIESFGELTLDMKDEDFIVLKRQWEVAYSGSKTKARIHYEGDICEKYWAGKQFPDTEYENGKRPLVDNVTFEALETMLPQATKQNPEPVVLTDNGDAWPEQPPTPMNPMGVPAVPMAEIGKKIHMSLEYLAQRNSLKTILKKGTRHWSLRFLGCWQTVWNDEEQEIGWKAINPKDLILDPNAYIQNGSYHGEFIGLHLYDTAQNLITRFPKKAEDIKRECANKLGSLMGYIQWRTDEYVVYTLKDIVLLKHKNENWNYDKEVDSVDELGQPIKQTVLGMNYWSRPRIPYRFLTVFDLGDEPCDKTSLVSQGLVTQDNINKRLKQIDRNTDNINGGIFVNGLMFNKEQAAQVAEARRQGRTVVTPGKPQDAVFMPPNNPLPEALYQSIQDQRQRYLERFGVAGSTSTGTEQEQTVRGKIIVGDQDASRTGGGVSEYLELVAAGLFEDALQFIYVFWDEAHTVSVLGPENAEQVIEFKASDIPPGRKIVVTVQTGSMIPQDELSSYNEAMGEFEGGLLDPLSFFEKTKDPNPKERAIKLMTYRTNPAQYMQEFLQMTPTVPVQPLPQGLGGSESGQPPNAVSPPPSVPSPIQVQQKELINQVPIT